MIIPHPAISPREEEYEYEEEEPEQPPVQQSASPSFPMLSLPNLPVRTRPTNPPTRPPTRKPTTSSPRTTTTTLPPIPVAPVITSVPVSVPALAVANQPKPNTRPSRPTFSRPKPKIHQPKVQQPEQPAPASPQKHIIVQPTYVEVTAKSSQPKTNTTQAQTSSTASKIKEAGSQTTPRTKYGTRPAGDERIVIQPIGMAGIRPRNQKTSQMYSKQHLKAGTSTEKAFIVEVTASPRGASQAAVQSEQMSKLMPQAAMALTYPPVTQAPPPPPLVQAAVNSPSVNRMKDRILSQLGSQFSEGISPELFAKIEKMLTAELNNGEFAPPARRRKPASGNQEDEE
ncbi:hypothetical protein WR25_07614 [Diploscapter pachys]|uniref:Uncharacterized protein n=1 Tax=Diploscapter pachys TaxID=2018661 RepID=A0A2A2J6H6_9BILA|nr:hypothetical protein WR25_07614 [Diploscapter pachys]